MGTTTSEWTWREIALWQVVKQAARAWHVLIAAEGGQRFKKRYSPLAIKARLCVTRQFGVSHKVVVTGLPRIRCRQREPERLYQLYRWHQLLALGIPRDIARRRLMDGLRVRIVNSYYVER